MLAHGARMLDIGIGDEHLPGVEPPTAQMNL
jgi:hypothetical protein